jgi:hypothetical protein
MRSTMRPASIGAALTVIAFGAAPACEPLPPTPEPAAPPNECPKYACDAYVQAGVAPSCSAGTCVVGSPVPNVLLVVGLPSYSASGPGQTVLLSVNGAIAAAKGCAAIPDCTPSTQATCALKEWATDIDSYAVAQSASNDQARWYLGNPSSATTLPVSATFRPLLGPGLADAIDLGLPLQTSLAVPLLDPIDIRDVPPGPNATTPFLFEASMPPGCYQRTLQPYAPLSTAFPPEIKVWPPDDIGPQYPITGFDSTSEEVLPSGQATSPVPIFDIARAEGLDGWTAYLRNIQNGRVYSSVASLAGSLARGVTLLTNHKNDAVSTDGVSTDALSGLALVLAPPAGAALPTEVLAPTGLAGAQELPAEETYPSLPTPVTISGRLVTTEGAAVPADIVFTATDITDRTGTRFPPNFEFVAHASTTISRGISTYSVLLPRGHYEIAVRPTDDTSAVTVVARAVGQADDVATEQDIEVPALARVTGSATVTDGRYLAEGLVEAFSVACATSAPSLSGPTPDASCLPREAQTLTAADGTFTLYLDPGTYQLRVSPAQGSHLPWVIQTLAVGSAPMKLAAIAVPAPVDLGLTLIDSAPGPNPVSNALVRVFTMPSFSPGASSPLELGQAVTDATGHFDVYLAPPGQ